MSQLLKYKTLLKKIQWVRCSSKFLSSKVPGEVVTKPLEESALPPRTKINEQTIELLERLSLVDFGNKEGIERLEAAIRFADQIRVIDTAGVEPMISVLEDRTLYLEDDVVKDGNCQKAVMANASVTEEGYFVAPPGNIPLIPRECSVTEDEKTKDK